MVLTETVRSTGLIYCFALIALHWPVKGQRLLPRREFSQSLHFRPEPTDLPLEMAWCVLVLVKKNSLLHAFLSEVTEMTDTNEGERMRRHVPS
jgi:hypothetical protein